MYESHLILILDALGLALGRVQLEFTTNVLHILRQQKLSIPFVIILSLQYGTLSQHLAQ
jgi:hypothetical protein